MKVIIAGSREITDYNELLIAITRFKQEFPGLYITEVVSGTSRGVDMLGEKFAKYFSLPLKPFPAPWKLFGKKAGGMRNLAMAEYADALIAVWDGSSPGTKDMIKKATKKGLKIYVHRVG